MATSKADMPASKRKSLASQGKAVTTSGSDEDSASFPITNRDDLRRAIRAVGRAKPADRAKVRRHIVRRAKALGLLNLIPDSWPEKTGSSSS